MNDRVLIQIDELGVAHVRLNRADKMNALDAEMFAGLVEAGEILRGNPRLRAVVISGEGRAFCAGLDMGRFQKMSEASGDAIPFRDLRVRTHGLANAPQQVAWVWHEMPVPVIAAVHGVAFGGGLQLALGADIRLVHPETKMSVLEIKWGLVPDMAGVPLLKALVRADHLRELTYTGRIVLAPEAVALGLATRVSADPLQEALAIARQIAGSNPDAIRAGKRLLNLTETGGPAELLMAESVEQQALIGSPNQTEAVRASLEKRAPKFADPKV